MPLEVFSEEWSRACRDQLNRREHYRRVAGDWISPVVLVMRADPAAGVPEERAVFLDLFRGECRDARLAVPADFERADFVLASDPATWQRILRGEMDPVTAVVFGRLRLRKGTLATLMPYVAAAREMVAAAAAVDACFPGAGSIPASDLD